MTEHQPLMLLLSPREGCVLSEAFPCLLPLNFRALARIRAPVLGLGLVAQLRHLGPARGLPSPGLEGSRVDLLCARTQRHVVQSRLALGPFFRKPWSSPVTCLVNRAEAPRSEYAVLSASCTDFSAREKPAAVPCWPEDLSGSWICPPVAPLEASPRACS